MEDSLELDGSPARFLQLGLMSSSILVGGPTLTGCGGQPGIGWESFQAPPVGVMRSSILVG